MKEQQSNGWLFIIILLGFITIFVCYIKTLRRTNPRNTLNHYCQIPRDKMIVALQIKNLLIQYSNTKKQDFQQIFLRSESNGIFKYFKKILGYGNYYRLKYTPTKIKQFLTGLMEINNTQLLLYTSLNKIFIQAIISKLELDKFFPEKNRRYCQQLSQDAKKHASQVDTNTRRVIIITPSYNDHAFQDSKYFLVLDNRKNKWSNFLKDSLRQISGFLQNIKSIDMLHQQLSQFKMRIESDRDQ